MVVSIGIYLMLGKKCVYCKKELKGRKLKYCDEHCKYRYLSIKNDAAKKFNRVQHLRTARAARQQIKSDVRYY